MNVAAIKQHIKNISGQSDDAALTSALELAAMEVWDSVDLPGVMRELRVKVPTNYVITLPWYIYQIRAIRNSYNKLQIELQTPGADYQDMRGYQTDYIHRLLRRVPLQERITNASVITFTLRAAQAADLEITIIGETDLAARSVETVTISAGSLAATTLGRYINIPDSIQKSYLTTCDIDITDVDGRALGVFPNCLSESIYQLVQIHDRAAVSSPYTDGVDVLYKPHLVALSDNADVFPDPYSQIVIMKSLEQLKLPAEDQLEVASAYNDKARNLLDQFTANSMIGKTVRPNFRVNPYFTRYSNI